MLFGVPFHGEMGPSGTSCLVLRTAWLSMASLWLAITCAYLLKTSSAAARPCKDTRKKVAKCVQKLRAGQCPAWGCDKTCGQCTPSDASAASPASAAAKTYEETDSGSYETTAEGRVTSLCDGFLVSASSHATPCTLALTPTLTAPLTGLAVPSGARGIGSQDGPQPSDVQLLLRAG